MKLEIKKRRNFGKKSINIWTFKNMLLNNQRFKEEKKKLREIEKYLETNKHKNIIIQKCI
jgi:hypothetical protein